MRPPSRRRGPLGGIVLLAAFAFALGACSAADDPEPRLAELDFEPTATLVVDETGFDADELEVNAGDTVLLVNEGDEPHSFVSTEPFRDTGEVLPGEEVVLRFDAADEVEAHDGTDPDQTVTIVVAEAPEA
jgi:plastocyanin